MAQNFILRARVTVLFSVLLCLANHLVPIAEAIWLNVPSSGTKCMSEDIQTNVVVLADYYVVDEGVQPHHTPTISAKVNFLFSPLSQFLLSVFFCEDLLVMMPNLDLSLRFFFFF
jgi:hypothetical protein